MEAAQIYREARRAEDRQRLLAETAQSLAEELSDAILKGAAFAVIATPGFGRTSMRAMDVFAETLHDDATLAEVFGIVGRAVASDMKAQMLVERLSREHGDWHAEDAL